MSDYSKTTNFTAKDTLNTGDSNKLIKGADFDAEFDAISTAITTKVDDGANSTLTSLSGLTTPLSEAQGGSGVAALPSFRANNSSTQSIPATTITKVDTLTEAIDSNSDFASNRFTPTVAGNYNLNFTGYFSLVPATAQIYVQFYKNGSVVTGFDWRTQGNALKNGLSISTVVTANGSTDYFEVYVYQGDSSARNLSNACFSGHWVGGA